MTPNNQNEMIDKLVKKLNPKFNMYENTLAFIFIISLIMKENFQMNSSILITISSLSLAILYYLKGFEIFKNDKIGPLEKFFYKIMNIGSSVGIIGILFQIQHYPGSKIMVIMGCLTLGISIPAMLYLNSKKPELTIFSKRTIIRVMLILAIGINFYFYTNTTDKNINSKPNTNTEVGRN